MQRYRRQLRQRARHLLQKSVVLLGMSAEPLAQNGYRRLPVAISRPKIARRQIVDRQRVLGVTASRKDGELVGRDRPLGTRRGASRDNLRLHIDARSGLRRTR